MVESASAVAYDARNSAKAAHDKIDAHEDLCALRYAQINTSLSLLFKVIGWGGALFLTSLLGILAWTSNRVIDSIDEKLDAEIHNVRSHRE